VRCQADRAAGRLRGGLIAPVENSTADRAGSGRCGRLGSCAAGRAKLDLQPALSRGAIAIVSFPHALSFLPQRSEQPKLLPTAPALRSVRSPRREAVPGWPIRRPSLPVPLTTPRRHPRAPPGQPGPDRLEPESPPARSAGVAYTADAPSLPADPDGPAAPRPALCAPVVGPLRAQVLLRRRQHASVDRDCPRPPAMTPRSSPFPTAARDAGPPSPSASIRRLCRTRRQVPPRHDQASSHRPQLRLLPPRRPPCPSPAPGRAAATNCVRYPGECQTIPALHPLDCTPGPLFYRFCENCQLRIND